VVSDLAQRRFEVRADVQAALGVTVADVDDTRPTSPAVRDRRIGGLAVERYMADGASYGASADSGR